MLDTTLGQSRSFAMTSILNRSGSAVGARRIALAAYPSRAEQRPVEVGDNALQNAIPVVLAGGPGTRLWPLSRAMFPKQFVRFFDNQRASSLGATLERLRPEAGFSAPIIMCHNDHRFLIKEEVERTGTAARAIILEPVRRNTAAATAVAALYAERHAPGAVLIVIPSGHVLKDNDRFLQSVKQAANVAAAGKLVLLGVKPTDAHTGYGCIRRGLPLEGCDGAFAIEGFCPDPDRTNSDDDLAAGGYYRDSGIFVTSARRFIDELAAVEPRILDAARAALVGAEEDLGFLRLDRNAFGSAPSISIGSGVLEKTSALAVLPLDGGWSDAGSWDSLWDVAPRDGAGNHVCGEALLEDTNGCYIRSDKALVATVGVKDLVIIDTPDALLVADRRRAQDVSKIVARLRQSGRKEQEQHPRNLRPWGYFETLNIGARFQVKLLHVKPGAKLSLQMHFHRSEHWIVVQGAANVVVGDVEKLVHENESVYIAGSQWHRLENPGKIPLELIEVQTGSYLGEDDIVRADDVYHRLPEETK
jgi:mannose-1-phosphate guanylyltransferase / mannose-6-phosphate isomerase